MESVKKMVTIHYWWLSIRPKTLFAAIGPVLVGLADSYHQTGNLKTTFALLTLLFALLMQVMANLVNDYFDGMRGTDGEGRLGPVRMTAQQLITPAHMRLGIGVIMCLAIMVASYLGLSTSWELWLLAASCVIFAYYYTAGPFPFSHLAMGEILAAIFFGILPTWGTYFIQTGNWEQSAAWMGVGPGMIAASLMAINNLRDREQDLKKQKKTVANLLTENAARYFTLALLSGAQVTIIVLTWQRPNLWYLLNCGSIVFFWPAWQRVLAAPIDHQLNHSLHACGRYLFLYCILLALGLVFG